MVHILYPLSLILYEIEELMMKLFDEMVMMKFSHVVVVVYILVIDLVHSPSFDYVDDYQDKVDVVLQDLTYVDKMYRDESHLLVDDPVLNRIITNELNDTI
jgi:hypothetical protein